MKITLKLIKPVSHNRLDPIPMENNLNPEATQLLLPAGQNQSDETVNLSQPQCSNPRNWLESEINFTKQIAEHLTVAIQQAETLSLLQRRSVRELV